MKWPFIWLDAFVVALVCLGFVASFSTLVREPSPQRGKFMFLATLCFGFAFLLSSVDTFVTLYDSPRSVYSGKIRFLFGTTGKNPSCTIRIAREFDIRSSDNRDEFTGDFSCGGLSIGDLIRMEALRHNGDIVRLQVDEGPDKGVIRNGGGDGFSAIFRICVGCYLIFAAFSAKKRNPQAITADARGNDSSLSTGVDDQSLLRLNKRS